MVQNTGWCIAFAVVFLGGCNFFAVAPTGEGAPDTAGSSVVPDAGSDAVTPPSDVARGLDTGSPETGIPDDGAPDAGPADAAIARDVSKMVDAAEADVGPDACVPESSAELCAQEAIECGSLLATDTCGDERTVNCGQCGEDEACRQNVCSCVAEADDTFCARLGRVCGETTADDNCGVSRTVDCGSCTPPETCQQTVCACIPEADQEFCDRLTLDCGQVTADDNCGDSRTVDCGGCVAPAECGGGGTPNVCACDAQSDAEFCAAHGAECGPLTDVDDCGQTRTVDCGACAAPESCGGGGISNQCGCTPISDSQLCADAGAECGPITVDDGCGTDVTVDCGSCADGTCIDDNTCSVTVLNFTSTVGESLRHNAGPITDTIDVAGCATVQSVTVDVAITHSYRGDISLDLVSGAGTSVRLKAEDISDSATDVVGNYPLTLTPVDSLGVLAGEPGDGTWSIIAEDHFAQDNGTFDSWGLNLECN